MESERKQSEAQEVSPRAPKMSSQQRAASYKKAESLDLEGGARIPLSPIGGSRGFTFEDPVEQGRGRGVDSSTAEQIEKVMHLHDEMRDISHYSETKTRVNYDVIDS